MITDGLTTEQRWTRLVEERSTLLNKLTEYKMVAERVPGLMLTVGQMEMRLDIVEQDLAAISKRIRVNRWNEHFRRLGINRKHRRDKPCGCKTAHKQVSSHGFAGGCASPKGTPIKLT